MANWPERRSVRYCLPVLPRVFIHRPDSFSKPLRLGPLHGRYRSVPSQDRQMDDFAAITVLRRGVMVLRRGVNPL